MSNLAAAIYRSQSRCRNFNLLHNRWLNPARNLILCSRPPCAVWRAHLGICYLPKCGGSMMKFFSSRPNPKQVALSRSCDLFISWSGQYALDLAIAIRQYFIDTNSRLAVFLSARAHARARPFKKHPVKIQFLQPLQILRVLLTSGIKYHIRLAVPQNSISDRSRASSASPHLAKDDRKPVALSAPGVTSGRTLTLSHYSFFGNYGNLETNS